MRREVRAVSRAASAALLLHPKCACSCGGFPWKAQQGGSSSATDPGGCSRALSIPLLSLSLCHCCHSVTAVTLSLLSLLSLLPPSKCKHPQRKGALISKPFPNLIPEVLSSFLADKAAPSPWQALGPSWIQQLIPKSNGNPKGEPHPVGILHAQMNKLG